MHRVLGAPLTMRRTSTRATFPTRWRTEAAAHALRSFLYTSVVVAARAREQAGHPRARTARTAYCLDAPRPLPLRSPHDRPGSGISSVAPPTCLRPSAPRARWSSLSDSGRTKRRSRGQATAHDPDWQEAPAKPPARKAKPKPRRDLSALLSLSIELLSEARQPQFGKCMLTEGQI